MIYYKNKALARVSLFEVVEPSVLIFNKVENATKYLIDIECGDPLHAHNAFDNGNSNIYNFANCTMQYGGIKFTVTATADGYAPSVSRSFICEKILSEVTGFYFDDATQTLHWNAVPNAANYFVSVLCANASHAHSNVNNGNKTSFCVKECDPGEVKISVYPAAEGWNSPMPSSFVLQKTRLATPRDVRMEDAGYLDWSAVAGAVSYEVSINGTVYAVNTNRTALTYMVGGSYEVAVRAKGLTAAQDSLWSDVFIIKID